MYCYASSKGVEAPSLSFEVCALMWRTSKAGIVQPWCLSVMTDSLLIDYIMIDEQLLIH